MKIECLAPETQEANRFDFTLLLSTELQTLQTFLHKYIYLLFTALVKLNLDLFERIYKLLKKSAIVQKIFSIYIKVS